MRDHAGRTQRRDPPSQGREGTAWHFLRHNRGLFGSYKNRFSTNYDIRTVLYRTQVAG